MKNDRRYRWRRCVQEQGNHDNAAKTNVRIRAAVWRVLGRLRADLRPGVIDFDLQWCKVPKGTFQMGGDPDAYNPWAGQVIDIAYDYWVAKYPVTYAHYEEFVAAGGYCERNYWTETGWLWKGERQFPYLWDNRKYNIPNHPVVGVTWYEACAFAQWIDAQFQGKKRALLNPQSLSQQGSDPTYNELQSAEWKIRLLTEAEWEKSARYPDARKFPWGNDYLSGYANINESGGIGRATAVGLYANGKQTSIGVYDFAGNVCEWTLSQWTEKYLYPENNSLEGDMPRSVRGGGWGGDRQRIRSASRDWDEADYRGRGLGIRLGLFMGAMINDPR